MGLPRDLLSFDRISLVGPSEVEKKPSALGRAEVRGDKSRSVNSHFSPRIMEMGLAGKLPATPIPIGPCADSSWHNANRCY